MFFCFDLKADNFLLLTEPKKSRLEDPNLKLLAVKKRPNIEGQSQQQFDITLTAETVAPFVVLDFKLNSEIFGQFLENGFFVFEGKKTIVFETKQNLTENQIRDNLTLKTLTDVV